MGTRLASKAIDDVLAERRRQIEEKGWTPAHDDEHDNGALAKAAAAYALHSAGIGTDWPKGIRNGCTLFWPWEAKWWKPKTPREDLVRATAMLLAEIERRDRAEANPQPPRQPVPHPPVDRNSFPFS